MTTTNTTQRKCVICATQFQQETRQGRPYAFCSSECKLQSKRTHERKCIICSTTFLNTSRPKTSSPYYCSEECASVKYLCASCGNPCTHKFCSTTCFTNQFPLPWTCKACSNPFSPTKEWLHSPQNWIAPKNYCSSACVTSRYTPPQAISGPMLPVATKVALQAFLDTNGDPLALPTMPSGMPFIQITPPTVQMHPKNQNAIDFWKYVLTTMTPPKELYNEWLLYGICSRGVLGKDLPTGIPGNFGLWPWVEPHVDFSLYSKQYFNTLCSRYLAATKHQQRMTGAKTKAKMQELIMLCESTHRRMHGGARDHFSPGDVRKGTGDGDSNRRAVRDAEATVKKWLTPDVLIDNRMTSQLQREISRYRKGNTLNDDAWVAVLNITPDSMKLLNLYQDELHQLATKQSKRQVWPWGPNVNDQLIAAHRPTLMQECFDIAEYGGYNFVPREERK